MVLCGGPLPARAQQSQDVRDEPVLETDTTKDHYGNCGRLIMLHVLTNSPIFLYVKIITVVLFAALVGYLSWIVRGNFAEDEKRVAVNNAVQSIKKELDLEREMRSKYETIAKNQLDALLKSISKLQKDFKDVSNDVASERAKNPKFYTQPLPEQGYLQWKRARELLHSSNEVSTQP
jgi:uncharacterized membrane-anchored protein YhcB (DUF1043 family)